jgi:DNA-binding MarR family transcriptional regulator/N-acetylglutamate synthase-like GNAT family acetyltransferase
MMDFIKELGELALGSRLKRLVENLRHDIKALYQSQGIDFEPFLMPALNLLSREKHLQITQIAKSLGITQPAATQFCNSLHKDGLIKIINNSTDLRKREVNITEKGSDLVNKLKPIWEEIELVAKDMISQSKHNLLIALSDFETQMITKDVQTRVMERMEQKQNNNVTIIEYNDELKQYFKNLNYEWLRKYFSIEPIDEEYLSNPKKEIIDKGGHIYYAKTKDAIIGSAALLKINSETYELSKMAVTEKYQHKGVGKKLMEACIKKAKDMGLKKIVLYSSTKLPPALNLYYKVGFRVVALEDNNPYQRTNIKMEMILNK